MDLAPHLAIAGLVRASSDLALPESWSSSHPLLAALAEEHELDALGFELRTGLNNPEAAKSIFTLRTLTPLDQRRAQAAATERGWQVQPDAEVFVARRGPLACVCEPSGPGFACDLLAWRPAVARDQVVRCLEGVPELEPLVGLVELAPAISLGVRQTRSLGRIARLELLRDAEQLDQDTAWLAAHGFAPTDEDPAVFVQGTGATALAVSFCGRTLYVNLGPLPALHGGWADET